MSGIRFATDAIALLLVVTLVVTSVENGVAQDAPQDAKGAEDPPVTLLRGIDVPVRSPGEEDVTEDSRTVSYEAYYDWDFGAVTLVSESGDLAIIPSPTSWNLRTSVDAKGRMYFLCFRSDQGDTYILEEDTWEPIQENGDTAPTLGQYDVQFHTDENDLSAVRFDRLSGRSWIMTKDGWVAIPGNLPDWGE